MALLEDLIRQFGSRDHHQPVIAIARDFREAIAAIEHDVNLTPQGKRHAKAVSGKKALEALTGWRTPRQERLRAGRERFTAQIREAVAPPRPKDPGEVVELALARAEVRRACAGMSTLEREQVYRSADIDHNTRRALEEIPSIRKGRDGGVVVEPFVRAELRDEVLMELGRRRAPEAATELDKIIDLDAQDSQLVLALANEISKVAPGSIVPSPVRLVGAS
jgi:hypothetical protein